MPTIWWKNWANLSRSQEWSWIWEKKKVQLKKGEAGVRGGSWEWQGAELRKLGKESWRDRRRRTPKPFWGCWWLQRHTVWRDCPSRFTRVFFLVHREGGGARLSEFSNNNLKEFPEGTSARQKMGLFGNFSQHWVNLSSTHISIHCVCEGFQIPKTFVILAHLQITG